MSAQTPRERLRDACRAYESEVYPHAVTSRMWHAAQAVLAEPEPAPLTASGEFLEALDDLASDVEIETPRWWAERGPSLERMVTRLLREPRPEPVGRVASVNEDLRRELGDKTRECERERQRLRETCQTLVEAVGAEGPCSAEYVAKKAAKRITELEGMLDTAADRDRAPCEEKDDQAERIAELEARAPAMTEAQETWIRMATPVADWGWDTLNVEQYQQAAKAVDAERHPPERKLEDVLDELDALIATGTNGEVETKRLLTEARRLLDAEGE